MSLYIKGDITTANDTLIALDKYREMYQLCIAYADKISDTDIIINDTVIINRKVFSWKNCFDIFTMCHGEVISHKQVMKGGCII